MVAVTPPQGGCTPVSYEVSHGSASALATPAVTKIPAGGLTARLGNMVTGQVYVATVIGVCADGTRTPPSAPVRFTPAGTSSGPIPSPPLSPPPPAKCTPGVAGNYGAFAAITVDGGVVTWG